MREGLTDEGPVSNYIFIKQRGAVHSENVL